MGVVSQRIAESESRTATETFEINNSNLKSAHIILDITAGAGATDTIVLTVDAYDFASKSWYNILTSAALDANATTVFRIGPDFTPAAGLAVVDIIPKKIRIVATKNNATAITYSIGVNAVE